MRVLLLGMAVALGGCDAIYGSPWPADDAVRDAAADAVDARGDDDAALVDAMPDALPDAMPDAMPDSGIDACPADYAMRTHGRYRFIATTRTFAFAAADCADDKPTGMLRTHLVVFGSDLERSDIASVMLSLRVWIGLTDRRGPLQWVTAELAAVPQPGDAAAGWAANEPTGAPGEDCMQIDRTANYYDAACDAEASYVCECDTFANDPTRY